MGNSPPTANSLRVGNGDHSYQVQLGESVALYFQGRVVKQQDNGEIIESWKMSYKLGTSTCTIILSKAKSPPHERLDLLHRHDVGFRAVPLYYHKLPSLHKSEAGRLLQLRPPKCAYSKSSFHIKSANAWGGITEMLVILFYFYVEGPRCLLVYDLKRKREDKEPYTGTITHYYADTRNESGVGFSVALQKIRVSDNGNLDFDVDGPHQHPINAFLYMFDQVSKTQTWKPTYCPHCADYTIQRQRASMFWQSESEDSDIDKARAAPFPGRRQNGGGFLTNDGVFKGHHNGHLNVRNLFLRGGR